MARLLHVVNGLRVRVPIKPSIDDLLTVLQQDKRICRDVLLEDSKITIFVHQPLTYLKVSKLVLQSRMS